jgi:hypothetical protein
MVDPDLEWDKPRSESNHMHNPDLKISKTWMWEGEFTCGMGWRKTNQWGKYDLNAPYVYMKIAYWNIHFKSGNEGD